MYRGEEDNDDRVYVLDGGVFLVPHDDHEDLVVRPVSKTAIEVADERPIHFANGGEWSAIFNDGTGRVTLFNEHEMAELGGAYEPSFLNTGLQHGAAIPLEGDLFAVTVANPDYPDVVQSSLPIGVEIRDLADQVVFDGSSESCPGMHGESHNHEGSMYGCIGGTLFIEKHDDHFDHWFINNPEEMREESRIGTVYGHEDSPVFFGKASYRDDSGFNDDGIWMIDPEKRTMTLALPASEDKRSVSSAFSHDGETLFVLTYDGMLNAIDAHDGEVVSEARLTGPINPEMTPSFIIVGETLFLTERSDDDGHVLAFDLDHMEVEAEWHIHGAPGRLAFLGVVGSGEHEEEEGHDEHDDHDEDEHDEDEHDEGGHDGHGHGAFDPHFWFDPLRVKSVVNDIAARLAVLDPERGDTYRANAAAYNEGLDELHAWTAQQVGAVPEERRILVTSHDSLQYFARLYGFEVIGTILPITTEVEASAEHLAELVEIVEEHNAPAIFGETTVSERLAQAVATETGAKLVRLYSGSLGVEGSGAETYIKMARTNVERIVEALK